jgi:hypothetical protein
MEPFARTINAAKKYFVSSALDRVDWNAEFVRGDPEKALQRLKRESGKGLLVGGVTLPLALAEPGLIDEYEFVVQPRLAARGGTPVGRVASAARSPARSNDGRQCGILDRSCDKAGAGRRRNPLGGQLAGRGPTLFAGLSKRVDLRLVSLLEFASGRWRCGMSREASHCAC